MLQEQGLWWMQERGLGLWCVCVCVTAMSVHSSMGGGSSSSSTRGGPCCWEAAAPGQQAAERAVCGLATDLLSSISYVRTVLWCVADIYVLRCHVLCCAFGGARCRTCIVPGRLRLECRVGRGLMVLIELDPACQHVAIVESVSTQYAAHKQLLHAGVLGDFECIHCACLSPCNTDERQCDHTLIFA